MPRWENDLGIQLPGRNDKHHEPTVKKPVVETNEAKASADKPKAVRKNNGAPIIKDWVSDSEEEDVPQAKKENVGNKSSQVSTSSSRT
ncbi:hypothetical protein Tco_0362461 [Tanacetum coccineum]